MGGTTGTVRLGLRENVAQFSLLVLVNAFVGGMVGLERTVVPLIGTREFGIGSEVVVFSFIITFGLTADTGRSGASAVTAKVRVTQTR